MPESRPIACSACRMRTLCLPPELETSQLERLDRIVSTRVRVRRGGALFRSGDRFVSLFAIRSGFFKTCMGSADGREQVTGFHMAGDILGMEAIAAEHHPCEAVALEDSEVCVMPFQEFERIGREFAPLQSHLHKLLSREIVRRHGIMMLLGGMRAEERVAAFVLNLVQRLQARGYSPSELVLRMTREDIGSYLGLTLETVSRSFTRLGAKGLVEVHQRHLRVSDPAALQRLVHGSEATGAAALPR